MNEQNKNDPNAEKPDSPPWLLNGIYDGTNPNVKFTPAGKVDELMMKSDYIQRLRDEEEPNSSLIDSLEERLSSQLDGLDVAIAAAGPIAVDSSVI